MNTTQVTQAMSRPKSAERLQMWAGCVTAFAWIQMFFGVCWGAELFMNGAKAEYNYSTLGLALIGVSVVGGMVLLMLAAWARAWSEWATS